MKKALLIIPIVLFTAWIIFSVFVGMQGSKIPSVGDAPYAIQTETRIFYGQQVKGKPPFVTVTGYWTKRGSNWVYYKGRLAFNDKSGNITVVRR